ncbi:molybdenum cofactor guanylyltransferase [Tenacibaculum sp. M341]|uniref:molybdenum cofactor guanylyltransferase n=1 Tax=Tenacibaculum sp. M341 TaxID=2530339 RepID=UPI0010512DBF|nr:molybdenum cofactor guanylyltransferase [Tenacibaculum sp. M341]TCI85019.1 molybdenum cofactor guanylyltransferase [Tenacibaculum sp. M341]
MITKKDITGIVLAGGKSSRMGTDKGLLLFQNTPFVQHSINALDCLVSDILLVSNNVAYDVFKVKRVQDSVVDFGPVAGIYAGLSASLTPYNIVLSCDIPLIQTVILEKLLNAVDKTSEVILIESDGRKMPLIALYKKECMFQFKDAIEAKEHKLQKVLGKLKVKSVLLTKEEEELVTNVNTKEELNAIIDDDNS